MEALRIQAFATGRSVFVPAAGIPWYVTLFGRDSLVVAMESISGFPEFAAGALDRLAEYQATDDNPEQDKEPGKVPHELRFGELAELGLLPFAAVLRDPRRDAAVHRRAVVRLRVVGRQRLLRRYRPAAEAALRWMLESGDRDGDDFQEYATRSTRGLFNQGWKDSASRSSTRTVGSPRCRSPCASSRATPSTPCSGWPGSGRSWATRTGRLELRARAALLYDRFNDAFWWEAEGTYYLGLDGDEAADPDASPRTPAIASRAGSSRPTGPTGWSSG